MNWSDYESAWKRQELPKGADADLERLRDTFESKSRKLAGALLIRDWSEISASIFVIGFYLWYWRKVGADGWPMALAIVCVLFVAAFFLRERSRVRRMRLGVDAPLTAKIKADIEELKHQRRLWSKAWVWYLAPCFGAITTHGVVIFGQLPDWSAINSITGRLIVGALMATLGAGTWWTFRRAIRVQIDPRIVELEKLHDNIFAENNEPL